ncbi:MAG: CPBP family intramembrane glutamic endopeptidase [Rhodothermales bacterium]|nr:CPBP family intramembrane glutamic endopeptidase [Rhodothermales bacterium]
MIGPILLAVSWILLKLEGKGLGAIGVDAPASRLAEFAAGFAAAGAVAALQQVGRSMAAGVAWDVNPAFDAGLLLEHLRWNTNSVLYEELLFRGYLLYQAIRWLGARRGVLLSGAAFGVYHWFSYGVFGSPVMMGFVFLFTGMFGLMFALAFAGTGSVAAPIGLHLGWNGISYVVFSGGPLGAALLVPESGPPVIEMAGLVGLLIDVGLPLLLVAAVSGAMLRRRRPAEPAQALAAPGA